MLVTNIRSAKGNAIANQFTIEHNNVLYFQSYRSIIAKIENGKVTLDERYWDYSRTTGKYRNIFLNEHKQDTLDKIESGVYELGRLNDN